jgi:hypothetical protein
MLLLALMTSAAASGFPLDAADLDAAELRAEFWVDLEPIVPPTGNPPASREEAVGQLLDRAQNVLTGLIYGYRFRYVPTNPRRGITDSFELVPVAEVPRGDPRLGVASTRLEESMLFVTVLYRLADFQVDRLRGWQSSSIASSAGEGAGSYFEGEGGRRSSYERAIRAAVRAYARELTRARPREVSGSLILSEEPRVRVLEGEYRTRVRIKIIIDRTERYETF